MTRLVSYIAFDNEPIGQIFTDPPYEKVKMQAFSDTFHSDLIPQSYNANINGKVTEINRDDNPKEFVTFLYQALTGTYLRATESKIEDNGN